jgi:dihydrofolate reductase
VPSACRQVSAFVQVSLDGYFCRPDGDMSFAHKELDDTEWQAYVGRNASGGGMLVFGRETYDMMAAWWLTPAAAAAMPEVAERMNALPKIVFSRTLASAEWPITELIRADPVETIGRLKGEPGPDMTLLGSGSIVTQLADAGLVDSFQVVINPVALGAGRSYLAGLREPLHLSLEEKVAFGNGSAWGRSGRPSGSATLRKSPSVRTCASAWPNATEEARPSVAS